MYDVADIKEVRVIITIRRHSRVLAAVKNTALTAVFTRYYLEATISLFGRVKNSCTRNIQLKLFSHQVLSTGQYRTSTQYCIFLST